MKRIRSVALVVLLAALALGGCSKRVGKEIAPGAFVQDFPIQLTQGQLADDGKCLIDDINDRKSDKNNAWTVKRGDELVFRGWAFSEDGTQAPAPLFIRLTGAVQDYYAISSTRYARSDVIEHFKLTRQIDAGFELRASIGNIEPGLYSIAIVQPLQDHAEVCDPPLTLIVN